MLLVDDLLLAPIKSLLWIFKEVYNAAQQDQASAAEQLTEALRQLYMSLETGQITEAEFDAQEKRLLDQLDRLQGLDVPDDEADTSFEDGPEDGADDDADDSAEDDTAGSPPEEDSDTPAPAGPDEDSTPSE